MGWKHEETKSLIWEALDALKGNRIGDAIVTLERAGRPKWHSSTRCAEKYAEGKARAMAAAKIAYDAEMAEAAHVG